MTFSEPQKTPWYKKRVVIPLICLLLAGYQFGAGAYIVAKAEIAQLLIAKAWERQLHSEQGSVKPWKWADTWPIAKLNFPRLNQQLFVLAGATDAVIAFGPGHMLESAMPGQQGNSVIVGHRDTHFKLLKHIKQNDLVEVQTQTGHVLYQVKALRIMDFKDMNIVTNPKADRLTLVTCYPFDALQAGTPMRYVVTADKVETVRNAT